MHARLRALIVDDEPLARSNLQVLLQLDDAIDIVGECGSGADAIEATRKLKPDLIFLDVQMPECDGFDVIELLGDELPPAVIFVTAYDEYALRAFEAGALDYLLKPFDNERFALALGRAKQKLSSHNGAEPQRPQRLAIKSAGQVLFLRLSGIDWIEAADYYACLHVAKKTHLLRRSLSELERQLDSNTFCRIHRSTIVNVDRVRAIESNNAGEYEVLVEDGTRLKLSRRYRQHLQSRITSMSGVPAPRRLVSHKESPTR